MPYKDPDKRREAQRRYSQKHKEKERQRLKERQSNPAYKEYQKKYRERNREKAKATSQEWRDTEHGRNKMLLNKYGITLNQYNELLEKQLHACAICKEPESQTNWGKTKRLAVDHCHNTGRVRGLLCQRCNTTLGRYEDDPYVWENFVAYLESFI
jgi:hypothetical protein